MKKSKENNKGILLRLRKFRGTKKDFLLLTKQLKDKG